MSENTTPDPFVAKQAVPEGFYPKSVDADDVEGHKHMSPGAVPDGESGEPDGFVAKSVDGQPEGFYARSVDADDDVEGHLRVLATDDQHEQESDRGEGFRAAFLAEEDDVQGHIKMRG